MPSTAESTAIPPPATKSYFHLTRTGTYGFLSALPLILLYEVLIIVTNQGREGQIRISSEVWLKQWTQYVEGPALLILGGVLILVGIAIVVAERKKRIAIRPSYFLGIIIESSFYAVLVAILVTQIISIIFAPTLIAPTLMAAVASPALQVAEQDLATRIALSIGAGIYEELLFRVILVGGMYWLLRILFRSKSLSYIIAAVVGALLFSAIHYMGELGDVFTLQSFLFRFFFGLALNVLYLLRGFGVAAWTHALYDIMVVTDFFG